MQNLIIILYAIKFRIGYNSKSARLKLHYNIVYIIVLLILHILTLIENLNTNIVQYCII